VRIKLDKGQPLLERLLPGMSVVTRIHVDKPVPAARSADTVNGGK
jgi:membrane fusion protein (multidrug efflux system)